MQFVDEVDIHVQAGHGGSGSLSFRREKFVPRGGPDGGNGGLGGSVYAVADPHRNTLVHFQFNPSYQAQRGGNGAGALRTGRGGKDLEIPLPVGTLIYRKDIEGDGLVQVADLSHAGQRVLLAKGGRGGLGNAHFATSTNRAPRKTQPGEPGDERDLRLQLKPPRTLTVFILRIILINRQRHLTRTIPMSRVMDNNVTLQCNRNHLWMARSPRLKGLKKQKQNMK